MSLNVAPIISYLDDHIKKNKLEAITAIEANDLLDKVGLLGNYERRKGSPFRRLLRQGLLPHAFQRGAKGSRWFIPLSSNKENLKDDKTLIKADKLTVAEYSDALGHLSVKQVEILKILYHCDGFLNSTEIAKALNFKNASAANLHIGNIGKAIAYRVGKRPNWTYPHNTNERIPYFYFVHSNKNKQWQLQENLKKALKKYLANQSYSILETEIPVTKSNAFSEGEAVFVLVNRYERDKAARDRCIELFGNKCVVCEMDFKEKYGNDIPNIIHVHHTEPLGKIKKAQEKDVTKHLVPLCPNCHAVVHSLKNLISIADLKKRVKRNNR